MAVWCIQCVCLSVFVTLAFSSITGFQLHPWLAIYCERVSNCLPGIASQQLHLCGSDMGSSSKQQMKIGYLTVPSRTTGSWRKLGTYMDGVHCPPASEYALMSAILVPNYGLNSSTTLWEAWESQGYGRKSRQKI